MPPAFHALAVLEPRRQVDVWMRPLSRFGSTFRSKATTGTIISPSDGYEPPRLVAWSGKTMGITAVDAFRLERRDGTTLVGGGVMGWTGGPRVAQVAPADARPFAPERSAAPEGRVRAADKRTSLTRDPTARPSASAAYHPGHPRARGHLPHDRGRPGAPLGQPQEP